MKARFVIALLALVCVMVSVQSCTPESTAETDDVYEFQGVDRNVRRPGSQGDGN